MSLPGILLCFHSNGKSKLKQDTRVSMPQPSDSPPGAWWDRCNTATQAERIGDIETGNILGRVERQESVSPLARRRVRAQQRGFRQAAAGHEYPLPQAGILMFQLVKPRGPPGRRSAPLPPCPHHTRARERPICSRFATVGANSSRTDWTRLRRRWRRRAAASRNSFRRVTRKPAPRGWWPSRRMPAPRARRSWPGGRRPADFRRGVRGPG